MAIPRRVVCATLTLVLLASCAQHVVAGSLGAIYSFGDLSGLSGVNPAGPLALGPDKSLYGTCSVAHLGISGTVFKIQPDGSGFTRLRYFTNALGGPSGRLALAGNKLYGTAGSAIYAMNVDGSGFTVLLDFLTSDLNGLILSGTTLYGITTDGGANGSGMVFSLNIDGGAFTTLHDFSALSVIYPSTNIDGAQPEAGLLLLDGTLYGTTSAGGSSGSGTIFSIQTNGANFRIIHSFSDEEGFLPMGELIEMNGQLYGTTSGGNGSVFSLNTDGSSYATLHFFDGADDGASPYGGLIAANGLLYGTTESAALTESAHCFP